MTKNISIDSLRKLAKAEPVPMVDNRNKTQKIPLTGAGVNLKYRSKHKGRSPVSGLVVSQFFEVTFKHNEALPKAKKMTDLAILDDWEAQFGKDWPKSGAARKAFLEARMLKLRDYRKRWNRGELYVQQRVTILSWRYDSRGTKVDFSDGVTPMTPKQELEWIQYFKNRAGVKWAIRS